MPEPHEAASVLVLGGAHIDRRGRIEGETIAGASNPGSFVIEPGGGGFNAARNLALLGLDVRLISPRGGDADGEAVHAAALACGIEDRPFTFLDRRTPSYTAILSRDGNLLIALTDMDLYRLFSPRRLKVRAVRDAIAATGFLLCDANLPEETLVAIAGEASRLGKPLAAIAISPAKAVRLKAALGGFDYVFMNEAEAQALAGNVPDDPAQWPALLRNAGLRGGAITRGDRPIIAFNAQGAVSLLPPAVEWISDVTGAGDAFAAGTLAGLIDGLALGPAVRQGAALAAMTIGSPHAIVSALTKDRLETMVGLVAPAVDLA